MKFISISICLEVAVMGRFSSDARRNGETSSGLTPALYVEGFFNFDIDTVSITQCFHEQCLSSRPPLMLGGWIFAN